MLLVVLPPLPLSSSTQLLPVQLLSKIWAAINIDDDDNEIDNDETLSKRQEL